MVEPTTSIFPIDANVTIQDRPSSSADLTYVIIGLLVSLLLITVMVGSTVTIILIIMRRKRNTKEEFSRKDVSNPTYDPSGGKYYCIYNTYKFI